MNERRNEAFRLSGNDDRADEGRQYDKDGNDIGDAGFHEVAMGLTPEAEETALEKSASMLVDLEEAQVREIAAKNPELGMRAYDELLEKYPDHEKVGDWREAKKGLEG